MDEEHSGDDKRGNNSFLMMANMIKPVMKAHLLNQGIFAYSGLYKQVRYFPKACKIMMSGPNAGISGTQSMRQRRREDEGPPKA